MPFPLVLVPFIPAIITVFGTIFGHEGAKLLTEGLEDMVKAGKLSKEVQEQYEACTRNSALASEKLSATLEKLGEQRIKVIDGFSYFIDAVGKIQNLPLEFETNNFGFDGEIQITLAEIKRVSAGASAFLGALGGAASGAVFGAAGYAGVYGAIITLGVASTGTPIAGLAGAAATNAALAALGGGALTMGGGGMALGAIMLNIAAVGIGALIGGAIFAYTGSKTLKKAADVYDAVLERERAILSTVNVINYIYLAAKNLKKATASIYKNNYLTCMKKLTEIVDEKQDYNLFTEREKTILQNNTLLVATLFKMANITMLKKSATGGSDKLVTLDESETLIYWSSNAKAVNRLVATAQAEVNSITEG